MCVHVKDMHERGLATNSILAVDMVMQLCPDSQVCGHNFLDGARLQFSNGPMTSPRTSFNQ